MGRLKGWGGAVYILLASGSMDIVALWSVMRIRTPFDAYPTSLSLSFRSSIIPTGE